MAGGEEARGLWEYESYLMEYFNQDPVILDKGGQMSIEKQGSYSSFTLLGSDGERLGVRVYGGTPKQQVRLAKRLRDGLGYGKIVTPCPSCGARSLFVGEGGHLTCSVIGCPEPGVEAGFGRAIQAAYDDGCRRERQLYRRYAQLSPVELLQEVMKMAGEIALMEVELTTLRKVVRRPAQDEQPMEKS